MFGMRAFVSHVLGGETRGARHAMLSREGPMATPASVGQGLASPGTPLEPAAGARAGRSVPGRLQRKLAVGRTDDPLELEADRIADQVMGAPAAEVAVTPAPVTLSRKCAACEEDERLHRKEADAAAPTPAEAPSVVHQVLRSPGQSLDAATRAYFEPRFGRDFAQVRVHADAEAAASAQAVQARAYAVGSDIVFGSGQYAPSTGPGRRLLAHELAHVAQQERGAPSWLRREPQLPLAAPEPQSLHRDLDPAGFETSDLELEVQLLRQWLGAHAQDPRADHLRSELTRLERALQIKERPFSLRFSAAWYKAEKAIGREVFKIHEQSILRGAMEIKEHAVPADEVWKHGLAAGLFLEGERQLVEEWTRSWADQRGWRRCTSRPTSTRPTRSTSRRSGPAACPSGRDGTSACGVGASTGTTSRPPRTTPPASTRKPSSQRARCPRAPPSSARGSTDRPAAGVRAPAG
ncbi:DUF4157 domain-containing protein [Pyxidicoccus sp. MSG2]|uniref:eCIS core domain-containing protein n=1 Tax=Pyxidicoccus sp. MSG2 TaxID=2996790 RepID=UPI00226FD0E7|nr:DUF4157 domain-containing protein [Pyxidicoccus sp. MSG2]MCY1023502.1 DUF4157 domain-containing protein [Pyxidicoccus sp. MSG2]